MPNLNKQQQILSAGAIILNTAIRRESVLQGHYLTGAMQESIEAVPEGKASLIGRAVDYTRYVNEGVRPERIPFGGTRQRGQGGGTSKYIQGLIQYFELKGLHGKAAVSAAFALARYHKKHGMGFGSAGSRTGRRRKMIEDAFARSKGRADRAVLDGFAAAAAEKIKQTKSGII